MAKKSLLIRFKMLTVWNRLGAIGSIASILGLVLFFAPMIIGTNESEIDGQALQSDLYIKSARFEPMHTFFVKDHDHHKNDFYETAFLHISILNLSNQDILVTSLEVVDVDGRGILSPAYSSSALGPDVSKNKPVKIPAGDEVEISYSGGFKFNGLVDQFDLNKLANEYYVADISPRISSRNNLVIELNQKLTELLSGESKIRLKVFSGRNSLIAEHIFNITSGTDIFDDSGKIQHSYFLGDLIHWLNSPYSEGILNKSISSAPSAAGALTCTGC
ncbi:MAG: hypothetical protein KKE72_05075 [Gammaproteobacteria bacterium]|nr:hypothetical protein [Gammaproteobacteria bacterium]MBU2204054.1 hypothetical protein [Gammaproteobacteria bacterium]